MFRMDPHRHLQKRTVEHNDYDEIWGFYIIKSHAETLEGLTQKAEIFQIQTIFQAFFMKKLSKNIIYLY